ncbi:MAG: hypothetical protein P8Y48_11755, partial [Novosphingobium sp.]
SERQIGRFCPEQTFLVADVSGRVWSTPAGGRTATIVALAPQTGLSATGPTTSFSVVYDKQVFADTSGR